MHERSRKYARLLARPPKAYDIKITFLRFQDQLCCGIVAAADTYHRVACEKLLDELTRTEQVKAEKSALSTAKYLWNFLTGMAVKHNIPMQVAA